MKNPASPLRIASLTGTAPVSCAPSKPQEQMNNPAKAPLYPCSQGTVIWNRPSGWMTQPPGWNQQKDHFSQASHLLFNAILN